jgi:Protein of unknown function (DUF2867)
MNTTPTETSAPRDSEVESLLAGAYFCDAWAIRAANPNLDALGQFLRVAKTTPRWVERLMAIRNRVVSTFGLKDLGGLSRIEADKNASAFLPGDRVGIFTLFSRSPGEVLLGDKDKHLDVVVSVHKGVAAEDGAVVVTVTPVVHVHNWLGRLYMLPVAPVHRLIARSMVRAVGLGGAART